jgi:hypothetical protein
MTKHFCSKFIQYGWWVGLRMKKLLFEQKMSLGFILFTIVHVKGPKLKHFSLIPLYNNEFRFGYPYLFYATFSTLTFNQSACASLH